MIKKLVLFVFFYLLSFSLSHAIDDYAMKRITKRVDKLWKIEEFELKKLSEIPGSGSSGDFFLIKTEIKTQGILYNGTVYTCGISGCNKPSGREEKEYFEFFLITDNEGEILYTEITKYAATHGHEVSSAGWLRQFRGRKGNDSLIYGKDIDAISGATRSGTNLTLEINSVLAVIHHQKDYFF